MDTNAQNSTLTDSNINNNGLPPLPPLPPENTINPNAVLESVNDNIPTQLTTPIADTVTVSENTNVQESSTAPVVNLIPAPTSVAPSVPVETLVTQLPAEQVKPSKKTDTYTVLIAFLGVILFVLLAFVGYLVYQVINLPTASTNSTVSYPN